MPLDLDSRTELLAKEIVDAAFMVHSTLGPGLLESVYEKCFSFELERRKVSFQTQLNVPIRYGDQTLESGLRIDLLIEDRVIVELKSVDRLSSLYEAQLLTYLKLMNLRLGLLINFNVPLIRGGIRRIVR